VHSLLNYAEHFKPNVLGTQTILQLACRSRLKPVHYVSSYSVLNGAVAITSKEDKEIDEDVDLRSFPAPLGGYG
jgi:thioester reductase-like protein